MRKQYLTGLVIAAIAAYSSIDDFGVMNVIAVSNAAEPGYAQQVSNEREVKVMVTLQNIPNDAKTWAFAVALETHTQPMNDDLAKSALLIAGGKQYLPLGWEGSPPGGHHRKGLLRFGAIVPLPASVELQIRLIGDPSPRNFRWQLK